MRASLALIAILLIGASPLAQATGPQDPSNLLTFAMKPTSGGVATGDIGTQINITGTVTVAVPKTAVQIDTIMFYFGNASLPIANATAEFLANAASATFKSSFNVPLVDAGAYVISAIDTKGNNYSQRLIVPYGADTLIDALNALISDQSLPASDLPKLLNQLGSLINSTNPSLTGLNSQLNSLLQQVSSLQASSGNSSRSIQSSVSTTNSDFQSLYSLLLVFVSLEGLLVGLVIVLMILFKRSRSPRTRAEEVEVIDS